MGCITWKAQYQQVKYRFTSLKSPGRSCLEHALCWVHAERAIKKLIGKSDVEISEIETIRDQLWKYYDELKSYQDKPTLEKKVRLDAEFDRIFGQKVENDELAIVLDKFIQRKSELLRVLEYPNIPLHNNSSEQDIRHSVIKRKISGGTRSDNGRDARDIYMTLMKTCRKNGLSVWTFFGDRIREIRNSLYLSELIRKRAASPAGP